VGGEGCVRRVVVIRGIRDPRLYKGEARAEAMGVLLENNMDLGGDATGLRIVDTVARGVRWVANFDAPERFSVKFTTRLVRHLGEDGASDDAKLGGVGR
jgi:hypothetical protein